MIDHFEIRVKQLDKSKLFYEGVLNPLGIEVKWSDDYAAGFGRNTDDRVLFIIEQDNKTHEILHFAFVADSQEAVNNFHQAGIDLGIECNGKPGDRPDHSNNYYAAFLVDPDGHNVEAVYRG